MWKINDEFVAHVSSRGESGEIVFAPRLNKKFSNEKLFRSNFETCVPAKGVDSAAA